MKSLLITGAGSKFVPYLLKILIEEFDQIILLSKCSVNIYSYKNIQSIKFDLSSSHKIPAKVDIIIHLASIVPYGRCFDSSFSLFTENLKITNNVMRYALSVSAKKLIFISSSDVYPLYNENIISLDTNPNPHNEYGLSKLGSERLLSVYSAMYDIPVSILRLGPVYSENNSKSNEVSRMIMDIREHRTIFLKHPNSVPSLVSIENACLAIKASIESPEGTFLISGQPLSLREFFELAKITYNSRSKISLSANLDANIKLIFDTKISHESLGWDPIHLSKVFSNSAIDIQT